MKRRDPVLLAWVAGLGLAALVFVMGPERFFFRLVDTMHVVMWRVQEALEQFSIVTLDAVRALAIGLFATFVVLGVSVVRRGGRARGALFWVSALFVVLAGDLVGDGSPNARWAAALLVVGAGAAVMTGRLRQDTTVVARR